MDKRQLMIEMEAVEIQMDNVLTQREYIALRQHLLDLLHKLESMGDNLWDTTPTTN